MVLHVILHGVGDIGHTVTEAGEFDPRPEGLLGDGNQPFRLVADLPAGEGTCAVTVKAADLGAYVHADDVPLPEHLPSRDPVDDLVVHRNTGRPRKGPGPRWSREVQERWPCPLAYDELAYCIVYFKSGHARAYHFARKCAGRRGNLPCTAHPLNISGRLQ